MAKRFSEFLESKPGKIAASVFGIAAAGLVIYLLFTAVFGPSEATKLTTDRVFQDADSGKQFNYTIKVGDTFPLVSPFTGKKSGYPTESCYWTKDGKPKAEPTFVMVNEVTGKPGPTFCPDCGRLVVQQNPPAVAGAKPPPTQAEYEAMHHS